jgi:UDP-N-acetylglucosamine enolpyruvyl transferase
MWGNSMTITSAAVATAPHTRSAGPSELLVRGGGRQLRGEVTVPGFKHSLVTVLSAAAAADALVRVTNVPDIVETRVLSSLLRDAGARIALDGDVLELDASGIRDATLDPGLASRIHGVVYLIPALLHRTGRVVVPANGGCQIGDGPSLARPVEQYISVLRAFGATAAVGAEGDLTVTANRLRGCEIDLLDHTADRVLKTGPHYSGASKMALLLAAVSEGVSTLRNLYPKPDVTDLVDVVQQLGAEIERPVDGTVVVHGRGGKDLSTPVSHALVPDVIEVVTWICAATTAGAEPLVVRGEGMGRAVTALAPELDALRVMGVDFDAGDRSVIVRPAEQLRPIELTIASHGVYSDSQPFLVLLAAHAHGRSRFTETVWANRFSYLALLEQLGMRVGRTDRAAVVDGRCPPSVPGRELVAPDLRGAAVALLAALTVPGPTLLSGTEHLARGYADLPGALNALGADIVAVPSRR